MCRWIARWYVGLYPHDERKFNRISNTAHRAEDGKRHPRCGVFLLVAALLVSSPRKHQSPYACECEDRHSKSERDEVHPAPRELSVVISRRLAS
jgi:hypothetical protein